MPRSCGRRELEEQKTAVLLKCREQKKAWAERRQHVPNFDLCTSKTKLLKSWQCLNHGRCGEASWIKIIWLWFSFLESVELE